MNMRNIIFDLDGTLIDSARLTGQIIDEMLTDRGIKTRADRDLIRAMDAVGGEAMIAAVMGKHTSDPAIDLAEFRTRHAHIATPSDLAFPGVADTLAALAQAGVGLAICSNKPQHLCDKILRDLGIGKYFTSIIGSAPDRARKPAPDTAILALESVNGRRETTFYCGDSAVDVATAKAAGLPIVLVAWGYGIEATRAADPNAKVIARLGELIEMAHGRPS